MNENPVALTKAENPDPASEKVIYIFEKQLNQDTVYSFHLTTNKEGSIPFNVSIAEKIEESEEEKVIENEEGSNEENDTVIEENNDAINESNVQNENELEEENNIERDTSINIDISFGERGCRIGYPVYFTADLTKYEGMSYSLQWQFSEDNENWTDIDQENNQVMEITLTEENRLYYWRVIADVLVP